jgi:hypothetical protein
MSGFYEPPPSFGSPFRERLLKPQWDLIAARLGRDVPLILRELYGDPDQVLRSHFYIFEPGVERPLWLDLFLPMDQEALEPYGLHLPPGAIAFADDEHGDPYFYVPDAPTYGDGPVYVMQHHRGTDAVVPIAPALSAFLSWTRETTY